MPAQGFDHLGAEFHQGPWAMGRRGSFKNEGIHGWCTKNVVIVSEKKQHQKFMFSMWKCFFVVCQCSEPTNVPKDVMNIDEYLPWKLCSKMDLNRI